MIEQYNKTVINFGDGLTGIATGNDKEDKTDEPYVCFWQHPEPMKINEVHPELEGTKQHYFLRMNFAKEDSLDSLISVLESFRKKRFPKPTSEEKNEKISRC